MRAGGVRWFSEGSARQLRQRYLSLQIINSLAKGRPADAALLAAGFRPPFNATASDPSSSSNRSDGRPSAEAPSVPLNDSNSSEIHAAATHAASNSTQPSFLPDNGESALLQAHRAAFFFKLERELEKVCIAQTATNEIH